MSLILAKKFRIPLLVIALCTSVVTSCGSDEGPQRRGENVPDDWPDEFVMGFFGGGDADELMEQQEPVREHLEEVLQIPVKMYLGTSYTSVIEAMRAGRADAMSVGPLAYLLAVEEAGAEAIAITVGETGEQSEYDADSEINYFSTIITLKGSGIRSLADLPGRSFAFVDPASTSGNLAPRSMLLKNGIDPDLDMDAMYAGSHQTSIFAVSQGRVDAGATLLGYLYRGRNEGLFEYCGFEPGQKATPEVMQELYDNCPDGSIAMVALSDPIPATPFAVRSNLPPSLKQAVAEALLAIKDNPELTSRMTSRVYYLDPTEELGLNHLDEYYNGLREMAKLLDLELRELVDQ